MLNFKFTLRHTTLGSIPRSSDRPVAETSTCQHTTLTLNGHPWSRDRRHLARRELCYLVWVNKNRFSPCLQHSGSCRFAGLSLFTKTRKAFLPGGGGGLQRQRTSMKVYCMCARKHRLLRTEETLLLFSRNKRRWMEKAVDWATCAIKSRIVMAKDAFNKKRVLFLLAHWTWNWGRS
jgi:hypothetical protein